MIQYNRLLHEPLTSFYIQGLSIESAYGFKTVFVPHTITTYFYADFLLIGVTASILYQYNILLQNDRHSCSI